MEYMSVREAAKILGVSRQAICKAIKSGRIKAIRFGNLYKINKEWFEDYLRNGGDNKYVSGHFEE